MEELKSIKEIVEVQEYSLFILIGLISLAFLLMGTVLFLFKNRRRRRKKPTSKQLALEKLHQLNYSNTKELVYTFEAQALHFLNEKNKTLFNTIVEQLKIYKYKKEIPSLDSDTQEQIKAFIKGLK